MHTVIQWMACTRGQRTKFFTPLYSDDNEMIVVGNSAAAAFVVFVFVNSSLFFPDDHLSIKLLYHKQITMISIRQSGLECIQ